MDYFEFYNIPQSLKVDEADLKKKFYANSKKFHPDFFTLDEEDKQMEALELSTLNNTAYKTLIDFDKRLHYLLNLRAALEEEGKNAIPQEFLMEMMDVNEAVMELQFDFEKEAFDKILAEVAQTKENLRSAIEHIIPKNDQDITEEDLIALKNYYLKSKYLIRLTENIRKLG